MSGWNARLLLDERFVIILACLYVVFKRIQPIIQHAADRIGIESSLSLESSSLRPTPTARYSNTMPSCQDSRPRSATCCWRVCTNFPALQVAMLQILMNINSGKNFTRFKQCKQPVPIDSTDLDIVRFLQHQALGQQGVLTHVVTHAPGVFEVLFWRGRICFFQWIFRTSGFSKQYHAQYTHTYNVNT